MDPELTIRRPFAKSFRGEQGIAFTAVVGVAHTVQSLFVFVSSRAIIS